MASNTYEGMFILDANKYARDPGGVSGQIPEMIQQHGGEVLASRLWDDRRLAFPIGQHRKGTYWLTYFKLDSGQLLSIDRQTHLNENVIRSLVLKVDPRIADALVQHALTGGPPATVEKKPATAAAPAAAEVADAAEAVEVEEI